VVALVGRLVFTQWTEDIPVVIYIEKEALYQLKDLPVNSVRTLVVIDPNFGYVDTWRISQRVKKLLAPGGALIVAKTYEQAFELL
jgi:hypothetical protein